LIFSAGRALRRVASFVFQIRPAAGLRDVWREGYGAPALRADLLAGVTTGLVALPLSMALAIAAGAPPQHGLYTSIVAGGVAGLLGSSRAQISGPTNNFVILAPIALAHGLGGLVCASMIAGALLAVFAFARLGRLIQYIPFTVTQGFTSAIGVAVLVLQLKDLFGLPLGRLPQHVYEQLPLIVGALGRFHAPDAALGLFTLAVLIWWPKLDRRVPAPLVALTLGALAAAAAERWIPGFTCATVGRRYGEIPSGPPPIDLPWNLPGPDGVALGLDFELVRTLFPSAFAVALLVAIESLLSAVVADALMGTTHDPDAELLAQGSGNFAAAFVGGFGATGALARTATNVRAGARSPVAALVHAAFLLAIVRFAGPLIGLLPTASLAAILTVTGWRLMDVGYVARLVKLSPAHDVLVLAACFVLTLVFDMEVGVTAGVTLASLLFMRRMAEATGVRTQEHPLATGPTAVPPGVMFYEVAGPFFFGAAAKLVGRLRDVVGRARALVLDVGAVPFVDATGLVNLAATFDRLKAAGTPLYLSRVAPEVRAALARAGLTPTPGVFEIHATAAEALAAAARALASR
jgi:SulP family sulfate permease